jgi:hypothetical protein
MWSLVLLLECQGFARHDGRQNLMRIRAMIQNQITEAIQTNMAFVAKPMKS